MRQTDFVTSKHDLSRIATLKWGSTRLPIPLTNFGKFIAVTEHAKAGKAKIRHVAAQSVARKTIAINFISKLS